MEKISWMGGVKNEVLEPRRKGISCILLED